MLDKLIYTSTFLATIMVCCSLMMYSTITPDNAYGLHIPNKEIGKCKVNYRDMDDMLVDYTIDMLKNDKDVHCEN